MDEWGVSLGVSSVEGMANLLPESVTADALGAVGLKDLFRDDMTLRRIQTVH